MKRPIQVVALTDVLRDAWEGYLLRCREATVFHRLAWCDAVESAYGHRPLHRLAMRDGEVVGVLPMMLVRSRLVGRVIVSVPYATYGGILAEDADAADALLAEAKQLCTEHDVNYLELRQKDATHFDLPTNDRYDTFRCELPADPAEILPAIPKKGRAACRKGLARCEVVFGREHLDAIYDLYAYTMRRLGSPNYSKRLFLALAERFGEDCVCELVLLHGKPVAGVMSFVFRDELTAYFSGSLPAATAVCASNAMYLTLQQTCVERGLGVFDFNRTRRDNPGPHAFKRHMGFTAAPLHYKLMLHNRTEMPNLSPSNRKFSAAVRIWKRLPLWMTRRGGALVTRWIP